MTAQSSQRLPPLLPSPQRALRRSGVFALSAATPIVLGPEALDSDFNTALVLRDAVCEQTGFELPVETHARSDGLGPRIELRREGGAGEAYRVSVAPALVRLTGAGPAGLRYAVETLAQLVGARSRLPACDIEDAPDLALRGVMLDVSRGKVPTLDTLKGLVDCCVRLKLNALMLYIEHTFRFRRHPEIGADASPLDAASVRALDAYAAARHVQLIPSLQSLGHMDRILNLPRYRHLAETGRNWTISPALPETYAFLGDLYDEYLPNFRSRLFNANCDETYDLGLGRSAEQLRELGPGGPFLRHVGQLRELAAAHGKRIMIWADMAHAHPERIPEFDADVVFLDWWYEAAWDYDRVKRFAENDREFAVCPGTSSWNALFPRLANSLENIRRWAEAGKRYGARGLLVTDWGDFGHYNLQGNSWFGYAWAAEQAWSGGAAPRAFDRAFSARLFGDRSGEAARLYRELGGLHGAGFEIFNGSALQFLFFDELEHAYFAGAARAPALRRTLRRLERTRQRIDAAEPRFRRERLTWQELLYAADASICAARKGLAGLEYLAWRRKPRRLDARGRRRLVRALSQLADEQSRLSLRLRRLWLARSQASELALTQRRIRRSVRSLRGAARTLEANHPTPPPPRHPGFDPGSVMRAVTRSLGAAP